MIRYYSFITCYGLIMQKHRKNNSFPNINNYSLPVLKLRRVGMCFACKCYGITLLDGINIIVNGYVRSVWNIDTNGHRFWFLISQILGLTGPSCVVVRFLGHKFQSWYSSLSFCVLYLLHIWSDFSMRGSNVIITNDLTIFI